MYYKICGHKIQHVLNNKYILDNFWFLPETGVRFPEFLSYEDLAFRKTGKNFPTKFFPIETYLNEIQTCFHIDKMYFYGYR